MEIIKNVVYGPRSDRDHLIDIYLPENKENFATFVYFHGGGIVNGSKDNYLLNIFNEHENGTWFNASKNSLKSREHWLAYRTNTKGKVIIDEGARKALETHRKSLLPKGIINVEGHFLMGQVVSIECEDSVIGKGIVNYSSDEIKLIMGLNTQSIEEVLHYKDYDEVIHANNMILKR